MWEDFDRACAKKEATASDEFGLESSKTTNSEGITKSQSANPLEQLQEGRDKKTMDMLSQVKECQGGNHEMSNSTFICFQYGRYGLPSTVTDQSRFAIHGWVGAGKWAIRSFPQLPTFTLP